LKGVIRGVESNGMLPSERELGISDAQASSTCRQMRRSAQFRSGRADRR
jgi:tRNA-binding EMAP/Myf-like protein